MARGDELRGLWVEDCAHCGGIHTNQWAYDQCADRNPEAGEARQSLLDDLRKARPQSTVPSRTTDATGGPPPSNGRPPRVGATTARESCQRAT